MFIFLGYPSERLAEAESIWKFLASLGLDVWFDKERVLPGEVWRREREAAQDMADLILHIISPEVLIRPGEVQRELKRTLDLAENRPLGQMFLIPIRIDDVPMPAELAQYHYVDFSREDWPLRIAKSVARKFEQHRTAPPERLTHFLATEAAAGGRVELQIRDKTETYDLQSDYFKYRFDGLYFDYVNAEIVSFVLSGYFSSRGDYDDDPVRNSEGEIWQSSSTVQVEEFVRSDTLISLRFQHFSYSAGAAHPNHGASTMNFGGENVGKFQLSDLFNHDPATLRFLLEYVKLGLKQQMLAYGDDVGFLINFDDYARNEQDGWTLLDQFNFDASGILINLSPYAVLPYAFGSHEIRIGWDHLHERLAARFKTALAPILLFDGIAAR